MLDSLDLIVKAAREGQNNHSRNHDTPIWFELCATYQDSNQKRCLIKNLYTKDLPDWHWPVLDTEKSIMCLEVALNQVNDSELIFLALHMCSANSEDVLIANLLSPESLPKQGSSVISSGVLKKDIEELDDIVAKISFSERNAIPFTRAVIVCSIEDDPCNFEEHFDDSDALNQLCKHQQYAMDGNGSVLWLGTLIPNYPAPSSRDVLTAMQMEAVRTGNISEIHIVAGDKVDEGDGLALIKNPSRLYTFFS